MAHRSTRAALGTTVAGLALVVACPVLIPGAVAPAGAVPPPPEVCDNAPGPGPTVRQVPWAQEVLAPERAWQQSRGRGVTVAVVDSGVDNSHPQLRGGKVLTGYDFLRKTAGAQFDCVSHGTAVASIIAASKVSGIGFHGIAPDARILPERVSEQEVGGQQASGDAVNAGVFARSIRWAVDHGADVLNLSVVLYVDKAAVRSAIRYARSKDVVIVAAVGNQHKDEGEGPDRTPYPAAYPGVIGVGATTIDGVRASSSQVGPYVDIAAPGDGVLAATRVRGMAYQQGTSFATPFVSGTVALIRSAFPSLDATRVISRLLATADPAPGGQASESYGFGIVNPYRAVTEQITGANEASVQARVQTPAPDIAASQSAAAARERASSANESVKSLALIGGIVGIVVATIVLGTRRRWMASRANVPNHRHF